MQINQPLVTGADGAHSKEEIRRYALGITDAGRRLLVVFTIRRRAIRVISARELLANKRDVPYQSLIKVFLAEQLEEELKSHEN